MSAPGDRPAERGEAGALGALERAVGELLERYSELAHRVRGAESRTTELERLVRRFTGDPDEAERLLRRFRRLEVENEDLRGRLDEGRAGVERLLAKIRFLEDQR